MRNINNFENFLNESKSEKDIWWDENYERLIGTCENIPYENWESYIKNKKDFDGVYNSTNKHRALYLLNVYTIEELEDIIEENLFDED